MLAVVSAGILCGNVGLHGMSPTTRIVLFNFWEYLAFVANSLVFLLIGLNVNIPQILATIGPITIAVLAVVGSRALVVYGLTWLTSLRGARVHPPYRHVLFWGGLRGAISLALVLSIPATFPDRELLRVMTFGVVLFTLLAQGTTMNLLLRRLGLIARDQAALEYERHHAQLMAVRAAYERLEHLFRTGMISPTTWEQLEPELKSQIQTYRQSQLAMLREQPALQAAELDDARREGLRAQRAMFSALLTSGAISEPVYEELVTEVDAALANEGTLGLSDKESGTTNVVPPTPDQSPTLPQDRM